MIRLGVNVDHVATVRNARGTIYPQPAQAAMLAELAGADNITCHLREDRRHIKDDDLNSIKSVITIPLNLEMAATAEMVEIAIRLHPHIVTLVPERREERTTEGGLDLKNHEANLKRCVGTLRQAGIRIALFIEPTAEAILRSRDIGAHAVELHTGRFCEALDHAADDTERWRLASELSAASKKAFESSLACHLGHGLHYHNAHWLQAVEFGEEANIGHAIVGRSMMVGFSEAVKQMKRLLNDPTAAPGRLG